SERLDLMVVFHHREPRELVLQRQDISPRRLMNLRKSIIAWELHYNVTLRRSIPPQVRLLDEFIDDIQTRSKLREEVSPHAPIGGILQFGKVRLIRKDNEETIRTINTTPNVFPGSTIVLP